MTGNFPEAEQLYLAAIVASRAQRDMTALGDAMGMLSRHYSRIGDTARAKDLMHEALAILEAEPPGPELARAYNRLAGRTTRGGRLRGHARDRGEVARAQPAASGWTTRSSRRCRTAAPRGASSGTTAGSTICARRSGWDAPAASPRRPPRATATSRTRCGSARVPRRRSRPGARWRSSRVGTATSPRSSGRGWASSRRCSTSASGIACSTSPGRWRSGTCRSSGVRRSACTRTCSSRGCGSDGATTRGSTRSSTSSSRTRAGSSCPSTCPRR